MRIDWVSARQMSGSANFAIDQAVMLPNTLALPARAERAFFATSLDQLQSALAANTGESVLVLGSGSNVVLPKMVDGLTVVMRLMGIQEKTRLGAGRIFEARRVFEVGAGESWQGFVRFCLGQGLGGGIENLTLIPGTVGAAPIQNIGAYGVEVAEFVRDVQVIDRRAPDQPPVWMSRLECGFGYRDSVFKQHNDRWLITRVRFELPPAASSESRLDYAGIGEELERMGCRRATPINVSEAIARLRRSKLPDPRQHPNAGSFFKNPLLSHASYAQTLASLDTAAARGLSDVPRWPQNNGIKLAAAALIERAGFKERPGLNVMVWYRQPLVLINYGQANADDVVTYARLIKERVKMQFGVTLEQEPVQVG